MTNSSGIRLREDQGKKAAKVMKKTFYGINVYVRAAVDAFQKLPQEQVEQQMRETAAVPRGRRAIR